MKKMRNAVLSLLALAMLCTAVPALAGGEESLKFGSRFYFDYFVDLTDYETDDQTPTRGFEFRRVYATVKKSWGDMLLRYTTDIDYKYGTGNLNVWTKYAYLQHSGLIPNAKILLGQHSPKTHGWVEKIWHYRSMAKTMGDTNKWSESATLGLGVQGKTGDGMLEYYLDLNNGIGYKKALRKDGMGFAARAVARPAGGIVLSGCFTSNTRGTYEDEDDMGDPVIAGSDQAITYIEGVAGFEHDRFSVYGQYGLNTAPGEDADTKSSGLSVFGRAELVEGTYALARFDKIDPDTDADDDGHNWILVGLDHEIHDGFFFQPSVRITSYQVAGPDSEKEIVLTFYGKI